MNNIVKLMIMANALDNTARANGLRPSEYNYGLPWGKIALATGLGIMNSGVRSAYKSTRYRAKSYRRKHF